MATASGSGGSRIFGWAILASLAYIAAVAALMIQWPDRAEDYSFMGDNTFVIIGVLFIAVLFILAMQLAPEGSPAPAQAPAASAFTETPPPPPPKVFQPVAAPAPPPPPPAPAEVVEASVVPPKPAAEQKVVKYPTNVEGGLYGDTMIQVDPTTVLQVRSILADVKDLY